MKAIACELPARLGLPLIRLHVPDIRAGVIRRGLVASLSDTTIWRWLSEDAIKPWNHRSWIFPRDPDFGAKAARVLDLYTEAYPRLVPVHLPVHASWLNQAEIYFTPPNATGTSSRVGGAN